MKKHFFVEDDIIAKQDVEKLEKRRKMLKKIWWRILGSLPFLIIFLILKKIRWRILGSLPFFIILIIIIVFNKKQESLIAIIVKMLLILLSAFIIFEWLEYCTRKEYEYELNNGKSYY